MPDGFAVTVKDGDGDPLEIVAVNGVVYIEGYAFPAAEREEFAQAWIAACHEADRQERPVPCRAVSPYAGPPCAEQDAHGDHVSRGPGGVVLARWPVSSNG